MLWPSRFGRNSTNPWDHDDFGNGEGIAHPNNPYTGPDAVDLDDDNDSREDANFDILEEGYNTDPCYNGNLSSDWDHDNDCIPDEDDKLPTRVELGVYDGQNYSVPDTLYLDAQFPAIFSGTVFVLNLSTGTWDPAGSLPVQVHVAWVQNGTSAIETIDVLSNEYGSFSVGQFCSLRISMLVTIPPTKCK